MATSALLISNSVAGSVDDDVVADVEGILGEGFDLVSARPARPEALKRVLTRFEGDHVIVAGGDGSLHLLVNQLAALHRLDDVVVGLIPLGTGNDFAGGVGIPEDPRAAATACLQATPTAVDVVVAADGEHVVNAAHAGVGAVAAERAQASKPIAGRLAYPIGAIQAAATESGYEVELALDGEVIYAGDMLFTLIANGPRIGGGARLCPRADPFDGLLDVLVIDAIPLLDRPGLGVDIQRGRHTERADVHQWRGRQVRISAHGIDHDRDGELRHELDDVTYSVRSGAWRLLR